MVGFALDDPGCGIGRLARLHQLSTDHRGTALECNGTHQGQAFVRPLLNLQKDQDGCKENDLG